MEWYFSPAGGWRLRWVCHLVPGDGHSFVRIMREDETHEWRVRWTGNDSWSEKLPASLTLEEAQAAAVAIRMMA